MEADIIVLCTGFERCKANVEDIMGEKVAQKVGDLGGLPKDLEQERIGVSPYLVCPDKHY
jgi:hypothetical protein